MTSFRVLELVIGSNEAERVGLAKRKMTRMLAPQVQKIFISTGSDLSKYLAHHLSEFDKMPLIRKPQQCLWLSW